MRRRPVLIICIGLFILIGEPVRAVVGDCGDRLANAAAVEQISLLKLTSKFRQAGYELSKLRFEFTYEPLEFGEEYFKLSVNYDRRQILQMSFDLDEEIATTHTDTLAGEFQGLGVGTLAYLLSARVVLRKFGLELASDEVDEHGRGRVGPKARKVWQRFARGRLARFDEDHFRVMASALIAATGSLEGLLRKQVEFKALEYNGRYPEFISLLRPIQP